MTRLCYATDTLEVGMDIDTAQCLSLSEDFAIIADMEPLTASILQLLYNIGWDQQFPPVVTKDPLSGQHIHTYTFKNRGRVE